MPNIFSQIWYAAASQCFLSLGTGFGILTMLSSYNKLDRDIYKLVPDQVLTEFQKVRQFLHDKRLGIGRLFLVF